MTKAIRIHRTGGPEVMVWEEVDAGAPAAGEVRIRHQAIGLNYIDCYHRSGLYPLPGLPAVIGMEAAGVVESVGEGVEGFEPGAPVAYASPPVGAYCEVRSMPAERVVALPEAIDARLAAASLLKGLTAHYLLRRTYRVGPEDRVLIHAAAGGVGLIMVQWARHLGATVIGTAGSEEKAALARAHGCHHCIQYREEDFAARVREITGGRGVDVVYDSVGRATFEASLDCLRPMGMMVSFGNASGPVPPVEPGLLSAKGSLFLTRPTLMHYTARREDLLAGASELFDLLARGVLNVEIRRSYPLAEAARAHRDLEARATTGASILIP